MMMLIKGGRVIDPGNIDGVCDILIKDGIIAGILERASEPESPEFSGRAVDIIVDAAGKIITPGLIDMHVHFREPGYEHKETIETGCRAAACGGFTAVCPMPNTNPVNDCRRLTEYMIQTADTACGVRVYPIAAISIGQDGRQLCDYADLKGAGAVAVSDDGKSVIDSGLMRKALERANQTGLVVISHSEDLGLTADGVINEGEVSRRTGLAGIPNAAESIMVMRDIALCELTGAPLHIAHVSTRESVRAIREAKKRGVPVTAETAPHYFTLTEKAVERYWTHAKMSPPLRSEKDRLAILEGLADGTIDVIATDHAPHSVTEKDTDMKKAPNGIIGLETSLPLSLKLVESGILSFSDLIRKMSKNPASIIGVNSGIYVDGPADITIIDPELRHTVDAASFQSKSRNTPFDGWEMKGKAVMTIIGGKIAYNDRHFVP